MVVCAKYSPHPLDAAFCTCKQHWNHHTQGVRHVFWDTNTKDVIDVVVAACQRDIASPCHKYTPSKDWAAKQSAPLCVCGRPSFPSHDPGNILDGIRAWRESHKVVKQPCGHFYGTVTLPGTCTVCDKKWIAHSVEARGLVIEAYYDEHEAYCKCIIMNGDVPCDCMDDKQIQDALDEIGGEVKSVTKPETSTSVMGCKQFTPKSTGNTHCKCGTPFHMHTVRACNGCASFMSWRSAHLSNKELLIWFQLLPGKNRAQRTDYLKGLLADPGLEFVPPANLVNPDYFSMTVLLDALTGSHNIQSPVDIEKIETKRRGASIHVDDDLKLDEEDFFHTCHACGEKKSYLKGQMCDSCEQIFMPKKGPALAHTSGEVLSD